MVSDCWEENVVPNISLVVVEVGSVVGAFNAVLNATVELLDVVVGLSDSATVTVVLVNST